MEVSSSSDRSPSTRAVNKITRATVTSSGTAAAAETIPPDLDLLEDDALRNSGNVPIWGIESDIVAAEGGGGVPDEGDDVAAEGGGGVPVEGDDVVASGCADSVDEGVDKMKD